MTSSIDNALRDLRVERDRLSDALRDTDAAIKALEQIISGGVARPNPMPISAEPAIAAEAGARSLGGKAFILRVFREIDRPMDSSDVLEAIVERGWRSTSDDPKRVIASTLSTLVREGKLRKISANEYALATDH
jgi:hypothetical protein